MRREQGQTPHASALALSGLNGAHSKLKKNIYLGS